MLQDESTLTTSADHTHCSPLYINFWGGVKLHLYFQNILHSNACLHQFIAAKLAMNMQICNCLLNERKDGCNGVGSTQLKYCRSSWLSTNTWNWFSIFRLYFWCISFSPFVKQKMSHVHVNVIDFLVLIFF